MTGQDWGAPLREFTGTQSQVIQQLFKIQQQAPGAIISITYGLATTELDLTTSPDIVAEVMKLQPRDAALTQSMNMTPEQRSKRARKAVAAREAKRITTHQMRNKS